MISLDDPLSYPFVLIRGQIPEDVALCLWNKDSRVTVDSSMRVRRLMEGFHSYPLQYLESYSTVVVLQRRDVIVAQSKFSLSVYLKDSQTWDFYQSSSLNLILENWKIQMNKTSQSVVTSSALKSQQNLCWLFFYSAKGGSFEITGIKDFKRWNYTELHGLVLKESQRDFSLILKEFHYYMKAVSAIHYMQKIVAISQFYII